MKKLLFLLLVIPVLWVLTGCEKKYTFDLENKPLYVIEGRISNLKGPYFVRITKSSRELALPLASYVPYWVDNSEPVKNALVIMSDDRGMVDTLISPESADRHRTFYYLATTPGYFIDSTYSSYNITYGSGQGYYQSTKIQGAPGHTYHLTVKIGNEQFDASDYMLPVTTLDSADYKDTVVTSDGATGLLPFVYFKEPQQEKNYYKLEYHALTEYPYDFPFTQVETFLFRSGFVMDDKLLPPYVYHMPIRTPVPAHYRPDQRTSLYTHLGPGAELAFYVRLGSLTKPSYDYFNQLLKQLQEDNGNVYKPAPATPQGNINGALGLFYATAISYKLVYP